MAENTAQPAPSDASPDLRSYDWIVVNTSGGKDSQTMLDRLVHLADGAGVRDRLVAVHADLGRVEWPGTRELAEEQAEAYGVRFEVVRAPGGDLLDRVEARGKWPDAARRWCTSDLKRSPVSTVFTRLAREHRERLGDTKAHCRILNCMGLRSEESPARRKKVPFHRDERASNGLRTVDEWLPIHELTADEVWEVIRSSGVRHHPAYDAGMPRLSCTFCVLASRSALVRAAQLRPELATEYVRVEIKTGHRFRQDLSISEIVAEAEALGEPAAIENWAA